MSKKIIGIVLTMSLIMSVCMVALADTPDHFDSSGQEKSKPVSGAYKVVGDGGANYDGDGDGNPDYDKDRDGFVDDEFDENGDGIADDLDQDGDGSVDDKDGDGVPDDVAKVYSVDVTWGDLKFNYVFTGKNEWNADQHKYVATGTGSWKPRTNTSNVIKMVNHSNLEVNVAFSWRTNSSNPNLTAVSGTYSPASTRIPCVLSDGVVWSEGDLSAVTKTATLTMSGAVPSSMTDDVTLGTATVSIN